MKIRKHVPIIYKILLSGFSIFLIYYFRESKSDDLDFSLKIMVSAIAVFGMLVKLILGYIFPEIVLDENGIKIFGRSRIKWNEIKNIETKYSNNENLTIIIERFYKKEISENFGRLTISNDKLKFELNSYLDKFGNKLYRNHLN